LTGALGQPTTPSAQPVKPALASKTGQASPAKTDPKAQPPQRQAPKPDPKAAETVNRAIEQLDPEKLGWIETALWQKVTTQGLSFQVEGTYRAGPNMRSRLELNVAVGGTKAESLLVSDGATVWNSVRIGNDERRISKWDLKPVQELLHSPATLPQLREDFFRSQQLGGAVPPFAGILPLLLNLRQQMVFTKLESMRWKNHDVLRVTAAWSKQTLDAINVPPTEPWPPFVPRLCRLYLDKEQPYWPHRIEWWGPGASQSEDGLLVELEFRNYKRSRSATPPPEYARAFTFDPEKVAVVDQTKAIVDSLAKARSQSPLAPSASGGPGAPSR
jgi:hypothetical protein